MITLITFALLIYLFVDILIFQHTTLGAKNEDVTF